MEITTRDTYQTISGPAEGEYKEKGSKFIAYAYPITSLKDFEYYMEEVKSIHPKARHHCFAYRLGIDGAIYRANDDGEPSGTAGKPIMGQLLSKEVSDILVVVVRYFGGTKLGASGLINAYKTATSDVLTHAKTIEKVLCDSFQLTFEYGEMGHVMNAIKSIGLQITDKVFESTPFVVVKIPKSKTAQTLLRLKAKLLQVSEEQIEEDTEIPFCQITQISNDD
ncbi:MAG: YigZ family protein [Bacteroidota bacterium]